MKHIIIKNIPAIIWGKQSEKVYLYIHGQGGKKEEASLFAEIVQTRGFQVLSIDLPQHGERAAENEGFDPWHTTNELKAVMLFAKEHWKTVSLFANSIGAWFSMLALADEPLASCLFLSPVTDMKYLIAKMMMWANVSEQQLKEQQTIVTDFGQTLYWDYWQYVLAHPISNWKFETSVLYGENDHLIDLDEIKRFCKQHNCTLDIMPNGEHWFHTEHQLNYFKHWAEKNIDDLQK